MTNVRLDAISFDAGTQVRAAINEQVVADYAERMTEGVVFPPVTLFHDGNQYYMADGFHRAMAGKRIGLVEISALVTAGTKSDALWFALGALGEAGKQGLRSSRADVKHAILLAVRTWPNKSAPQLAEHVGCTEQYVREIRRQIEPETGFVLPETTIGRDGKPHPTSRAAIQRKRDQIAECVKRGQSNTEIKKALGGASDDAIASVRKELGMSRLDMSASAVSQRRKDVADMAARGFTTRQIASHLDIGEQRVGDIAKAEGIVIHADRAVGKTKRHDSNRIIAQIVSDAENLTEGVNLIEFDDVDKTQLPGWLTSLQQSRDKLNAFIRRLTKEQQHGEAA